jgi:hypothetical protein
MRNKSLFIITFLFLVLIGTPVWAANHYVREGAPGANNGSDWTNAFIDFPTTLVRGDIYYVADGNYCPVGYRFDDPIDGEKYIRVLKATISSHGTDTGWNDQYGDGQAIFTESIAIRTSYIVFDGVVGGIPVNGTIFPDTAAYGFSVVPENIHGVDHVLINAPHSADIDHIQISHCLLISQGKDWDNGEYRQCGIYVGGDYATHHYLISHNYMRNGTVGLLLYHNSNTIVENNYFMSNWTSGTGAHGELVAAGCNLDDVIFRNNVFYEPVPYAIGAIHSGDPSPEGGNERWQVYNNIVIGSVSMVKLNAAFGNADSAHPNRIVNCDFHHNVFYNMDFGRGAIFIGYAGITHL